MNTTTHHPQRAHRPLVAITLAALALLISATAAPIPASAQSSPAEPSSAQTSADQSRTAESPSAQPSTDPSSPAQPSSAEPSSGQRSTDQSGIDQASADPTSTGQSSADQSSTDQADDPPQAEPERSVRAFPRVSLFAPLAADPRWPKFALGYSYYFGDSQFNHVGTVEAGASIAIVQKDTRRSHSWEIGFQAGIFSIFDLAASSTDLLNADYLGGLTFSYAFHFPLVLLTRFFHLSAHLGDEFILNNDVDRINLSFEELEVLLSYEPRPWARVYGGAAAIVRIEPSNIDRWTVRTGAEFRPVTSKTKVRVQLLAAVDLQLWQQNDWVPDASFIVGATLDPIGESSYRVDFLLRYYIGRSPNGQFFTDRIHTLGPAAQLYF